VAKSSRKFRDSGPSLELKTEKYSCSKEQQDSTVLANIVAKRATTAKLNQLNPECIISLERFSSLQRLIRLTADVLQFVSNLKRKKANNELIDGEIKQGASKGTLVQGSTKICS